MAMGGGVVIVTSGICGDGDTTTRPIVIDDCGETGGVDEGCPSVRVWRAVVVVVGSSPLTVEEERHMRAGYG